MKKIDDFKVLNAKIFIYIKKVQKPNINYFHITTKVINIVKDSDIKETKTYCSLYQLLIVLNMMGRFIYRGMGFLWFSKSPEWFFVAAKIEKDLYIFQ